MPIALYAPAGRLRNALPLLASLILPAASQAQIRLEPPRVDFGERGQNERPETTVILRNLGTSPLTLKEIKKSCDCLGFSPDRFAAPIPAGGQTELKITMGSGRAMGRLEKHLTILTSSTSQPEVSLPVAMSVLDGFEMEPRGVTLYGVVGGPPERVEVAVKLRRGARPQRVDLAVREVRSVFGRPSGRHLRASASSGAGEGRIAVELDPAHPEGPISAEIEATLNGRTLIIPVNGEMFAWIKISPNTINFSRALEDDPASTVRELTLTSADATTFRILKIESRPRRPGRPGESAVKLEFSIEPSPPSEGGAAREQKVRCRASRGGEALVTFDGTVTIQTDHPKKPEIVLKYSGLFAESRKAKSKVQSEAIGSYLVAPMNTRDITLGELAGQIGGELVGDGRRTITAVRPFDEAGASDLTFLDHKNAKMVAALPASKAGAVIVNKSLALPAGLNAIRIDPPHLGLARALAILHRRPRPELGVSPASRLGSGVVLGERVNVYPGAYLGDGVRIGDDTDILPGAFVGDGTTIGSCCVIHPHATIYANCRIGDRVTIHAGAVIGADGFGYVPEPRSDEPSEPFRHVKIPQVGRVVIEDDVEIGANTTIDRATLAATVIGRGTKVDNLVMIGHNCTVGRHSIIVAQAGISGSTDIGSYVTIAGQAGIVGHITVGDRAVVTAKAGVTKDVEADKVVIGAPAMDIREGRLAFKLLQRLPDFKAKIEDLLRRVKLIEDSAGSAGGEKKPE